MFLRTGVCVNVILLVIGAESTENKRRRVVDQSQSGETNFHVTLDNLHIIALLKDGPEDYMEYDYAYDYGEMTIKPQNGSVTPKPDANTTQDSYQPATNNTFQTNSTNSSDPSSDIVVAPLSSSTSQPTVASYTNLTDEITSPQENNPNTPAVVDKVSTTTESKEVLEDSITETAPTNSTKEPENQNCKKGFRKNKKGECELKLKNNSTNALLKLVELSQKLKLRRENRHT